MDLANVTTWYKRATVTALWAFVILLFVAPAAQALPTDPFTPKISVSMSSYKAGAHPDLTVKMKKQRNHCPGWLDVPAVNRCSADEIYIEQDLKKIATSLPPGLLPDANAAPYCDAYRDWVHVFGRAYGYKWLCRNPESMVGEVDIITSGCFRNLPYTACTIASFGGGGIPSSAMAGKGVVYNERPSEGEQGHLIVLWQGDPDERDHYTNLMRNDISIKVRDSDAGIDTTADPIINWIEFITYFGDEPPPEGYPIPEMNWPTAGQISDMSMTLYGSKGANEGHPLLTNLTSCDPQTIEAEFQGYKRNWVDPPSRFIPGNPVDKLFVPSSGEDKTASDSVTYTTTDCDALPYSPTFTAASDTDTPGKPVALSTVITQKDNEATTKKVDVEFPKGMGINIGTTLKPCTAEKPDRNKCPNSFMGTVEAESRVLPIDPPNNGPLRGDVFLTGQKGSRLSLAVLLSGFVNLRFDATAGVDSSGGLTATFDDLPPVPLSKFTLNLAGGDKSLITNPRRCGDNTTKATFTSHSGKTRVVKAPMKIAGCSNPTFNVEISEKGRGKRTTVELEVQSDQKPIKEVKFGLARHLNWTNKGLGKKRKRGAISVTSASGTQEAALKLGQGVRLKKKKAINLQTNSALSANLYRQRFKRKGVKVFKHKANKRDKRLKTKTMPKNMLSLKSLPGDDLSRVTVELNPDETKFIRTPRKCKELLWLAIVKTTDGAKHYLRPKQPAELNCKKAKRKKSKSKKK